MDELRFSVNEMAALFGVTSQTIATWAGEGMPFVRVKAKVNRYPWLACHEWWLANKYAGPGSRPRSERPPTKSESEAKLFAVKAERERMRLEIDRQNLVPAADIEPTWVQAAAIVKDRVLGIPAAMKLHMPALTAEDLAKARELCRGTLEALAVCPKIPLPQTEPPPSTD
jgi:phage terminase Nu1 subunit (DNA packaging protein)